MRPAFLDAMSWEMAEVYGAVTDQILINLAHYFPYYNARNFPRSSITYQADMLAQMGQVNKETMAIIRRNLVGVDKYLNAALEQVIIDSVKDVNPELWKAVKKGIFMPPQTPVVSPNQYRAFNLYYTQAANKLNLVNTVMLESTQAAYRETVADIAARVQATQTALDIGAGEVVTGVSSWNKATANAIKRLQQNGITGFIDHGGHRWSAEAYVAMDIRTTMFNTGRAAVWETNQNFGNDLYQVSYHNGARPLCYPWQSKVISSTDNARVVADLDGYEVQVYAQSETSYGEPAGLFGINCRHYPTPFIPGVSIVREGGQDEEENAKSYAESQQQRGLERKIREEKRDLLMLKAQGAPDELIKAQRAKIRQTDDDIDAFCDATGRARRQNREAVFTKREFPSSKTYDVALFEQQQKEMIEGFYSVGGAQVEFSNTPGMTPNVPLVAKPRPTAQPTPSTFNYGKPFDDSGYRAPQKKQLAGARSALDAAPAKARAVWEKCAPDLKAPEFGGRGVSGAHYSPATKRTYYKTYKEAFDESGYQRKNVVWFHEYGHNLDNLLGDSGKTGYISTDYKAGLFGQTIEKECEAAVTKFYLHDNGYKDAFDAVRAAQESPGGMGFNSFVRQALKSSLPRNEFAALRDMMEASGYAEDTMRQIVSKHLQPLFDKELVSMVHSRETGRSFCKWVKKTYSIYERSDISDMFERYTVSHYDEPFPFDIGHGRAYTRRDGATSREAFAEMYSAYVTQNDSLPVIKDFFPEAFALFEEMLGSVI